MGTTKDLDFPLLKSDVTQLVQEAVLSTLEGNAYDHKKVREWWSPRLAAKSLSVVPQWLYCVYEKQVNDWVTNVTTSCIDDLRQLSPVRAWPCTDRHWCILFTSVQTPVFLELQVRRHVLHPAAQGRGPRVPQASHSCYLSTMDICIIMSKRAHVRCCSIAVQPGTRKPTASENMMYNGEIVGVADSGVVRCCLFLV